MVKALEAVLCAGLRIRRSLQASKCLTCTSNHRISWIASLHYSCKLMIACHERISWKRSSLVDLVVNFVSIYKRPCSY